MRIPLVIVFAGLFNILGAYMKLGIEGEVAFVFQS